MLKVISLGWGVQSWTLAAMVALKELEPVDFAIHSDTKWEHQHTYKFAAEWGPWLEQHGITVITVSDGAQAERVTTHKTDIPAFTLSVDNGVMGQLRRQCTGRWKITPMRRYISDELTRRNITKRPGVVEQWLGITTDEWLRAKDSDVKYITHRYPLLDLRMSRGDCLNWLQAHNLPTPGKSACTFCPYHSVTMWNELKRANGADWVQAVAVDEAIRDKRPPYPLFVHSARIPLIDAVKIPEDYGATQLRFDDDDAQCDSGYCFL